MATEKDIRAAINEIENVETLRQIFQDVADALRRKGVAQETIYPEEYAGLIDGIDTNEGGVDTSDGTAAATDIAKDKIAYVKGAKVVGNVNTVENGSTYGANGATVSDNSGVQMEHTISNNTLLRPNSKVQLRVNDYSQFGTATAADVVSGKTFTGAGGFKKPGTASLGVDTNDGTAAASDIASGKVAYVKGNRVTGTLPESSTIAQSLTPQVSSSYFDFYYTVPNDTIIRSGKQINLYCNSSVLGNATAADVAAGKTFTSTAGLKVAGTATIGESIMSIINKYNATGLDLTSSTIITTIRNYFNMVTLGISNDLKNQSTIGPFVTLATAGFPSSFSFPLTSGSWGNMSENASFDAKPTTLRIPIIISPALTDSSVDMIGMTQIYNNYKGIAFVSLTEKTKMAFTNYPDSNEYIIGGYYLKSNSSNVTETGYVSLQKGVVNSYKYTNNTVRYWTVQIKAPGTRISSDSSNKSHTFMIGDHNWIDLALSNTTTRGVYPFVPGYYLALVW